MYLDEQPGGYFDDDCRYELPWGKRKAEDGQLQISQLEWFVHRLLLVAVAFGVALLLIAPLVES